MAEPRGGTRLRRLLGVILIMAGLALVPLVGSTLGTHRSGHLGADCGTAWQPSELSQYRPRAISAGCADIIDDAFLEAVGLVLTGIVLVVAGSMLMISGRLGRAIVTVAVLAAVVLVLVAIGPNGKPGFFGLVGVAGVAIVGIVAIARSALAERTAQ